jgi:hypothetical protein
VSGTREEEEEVDLDDSHVDEETQGRIFRFARKLMDRKDLGVDTRELLHSMAVTSDKAKTEAMKLIAREVRSYLDEMHLEDLIHQVLQSYSVEVSIRLNPLSDTPDRSDGDEGEASADPTPQQSTEASEKDATPTTASEPT